MTTYQRFVSFYICDLNLEVIEIFLANNYRLPHWKKTVPFARGNFRKFVLEFLVEWYVSALCLMYLVSIASVWCLDGTEVILEPDRRQWGT